MQKDAIAKLQAVVDEVLTPDGVKKMKDYFGNLREIDRVVLLVPSDAGCSSGLTNKSQSVNAKAFTHDVQSEVKQFMHTIFVAVMSTAIKNIDEEDWTALHENLLLSEKYMAGCEKDPTLTNLLNDHDQRGHVKHKMENLHQQWVENAISTFKSSDQHEVFSHMNEVLLSLYKLAAVYKYVLKYKADFQQAISIILVKATSMQWGGGRVCPHSRQVFGEG